jgi:hypothetical protein
MRPDERYPDAQHLLQVANEAQALGLWVAMPGMVSGISNLAGQQTVEIQPTIRGIQTSKTQVSTFVDMPILPDVPVCFPSGGGYVATFPIEIGDEALVIFSSRNIDAWWERGGINPPMDQRHHDLSDGFAIIGPRSKPKAIANFSTSTMQLRSLDLSVFVELNFPAKTINVKAPAGIINLTAPQVNINASTGVLMTTPIVTVTGIINVEGSGAGAGNTATFAGSIHATGTVASDTAVTAPGATGTISLGLHLHENAGGTGNSGVPIG